MTSTGERFDQALDDVVSSIGQASGLEETLATITVAAPRVVPGFDHASISIGHPDGKIETRASSSELVRDLDALQYEVNDGPCVDSLRDGTFVEVEDVRHEQRWPTFIAAAARAGVRSQFAVPLRAVGSHPGGAINLYRLEGQGIEPEAREVATLFAGFATTALGWRRTEEQLGAALDTRKVIGQAIGITMERYRVDESRAFTFLSRLSSTQNVKLRDVAQQIVTGASAEYRAGDA